MADSNLMIPGWTLVAVPVAYHVIVRAVQSWRGAEKHFVTSKDHLHLEQRRDDKCRVCEGEIADLKAVIMPRKELETIFEGIRNDLKERKDKTHKLRNSLNKIIHRQHLMHVMVVAIGTKIGADEAMEEAVRKYRELTALQESTNLQDDDDDEVDPV